MNVAQYSALALAAAQEITGRGRAVLVVGGSGFYLRSFLAPVADGMRTCPSAVLDASPPCAETGGPAGAGRRAEPDEPGRARRARHRQPPQGLERPGALHRLGIDACRALGRLHERAVSVRGLGGARGKDGAALGRTGGAHRRRTGARDAGQRPHRARSPSLLAAGLGSKPQAPRAPSGTGRRSTSSGGQGERLVRAWRARSPATRAPWSRSSGLGSAPSCRPTRSTTPPRGAGRGACSYGDGCRLR